MSSMVCMMGMNSSWSRVKSYPASVSLWNGSFNKIKNFELSLASFLAFMTSFCSLEKGLV